MLGNFEKAMNYHQKALSIKKAGLASNSPAVLASMKSIGTVQEARGDYTGAILSYEAVAKEQKQHMRQLPSHLPDMHPHKQYLAREIGDTFQQIARAQFTQNNFVSNDAVKRAVREAISFYRKAGVDDSSPTMIALSTFVS
jgi:lipopolysaccharide biosynthesis regulator YciM